MRKLFMLLLAAAVLVTAGCIDYEEYLVINKDGSGSIKIHYSIDKSYLEQMQQLSEQMGGEKQSMADMAKEMMPMSDFEEGAMPAESGVKLVYFKPSETDEAFAWDMKCSFDNFKAFYALEETPSEEDTEADSPISSGTEISFTKQEDGTWLFVRALNAGSDDETEDAEYGGNGSQEEYSNSGNEPDVEEPSEETSDEEDKSMDMGELGEAMQGLSASMQKMAEDAGKHKIKITVEFPGQVLESNATKVEGNTATWEYPLDQMMSAPPSLRAVIE